MPAPAADPPGECDPVTSSSLAAPAADGAVMAAVMPADMGTVMASVA